MQSDEEAEMTLGKLVELLRLEVPKCSSLLDDVRADRSGIPPDGVEK